MSDIDHVSSAARTHTEPAAGESCVAFAIIDRFSGLGPLGSVESSPDGCELDGATGVGQEAIMTDAPKTLWQHVKQKTAHELVGSKHHRLGLVLRAICLPAKSDLAILAGEKTTVGDRDAVGIAAEIGENLLWPAEWVLGVDDLLEAT